MCDRKCRNTLRFRVQCPALSPVAVGNATITLTRTFTISLLLNVREFNMALGLAAAAYWSQQASYESVERLKAGYWKHTLSYRLGLITS